MEPQSSKLNSFEFFPRLPTEIRMKIWRLTIPREPRLIPCRPIAGLAVNRESRDMFLEVLSPCFTPEIDLHTHYDFPISHYANLEKDTLFIDAGLGELFLSNSPLELWLYPKALEKIHHIAIVMNLWPREVPRPGGHQDCRTKIVGFSQLKIITLVKHTSIDSVIGNQRGIDDLIKALTVNIPKFPKDTHFLSKPINVDEQNRAMEERKHFIGQQRDGRAIEKYNMNGFTPARARWYTTIETIHNRSVDFLNAMRHLHRGWHTPVLHYGCIIYPERSIRTRQFWEYEKV